MGPDPASESVLFIGTQFSILYTSMYLPAEASTPFMFWPKHAPVFTNTLLFELVYGFPARVSLMLDLAAHTQLTGDLGAAD